MEEETYRLTMGAILMQTLAEFRIDVPYTAAVMEHVAQEFMDRLEKTGYVGRKDDKENN